MTAGNAQTTVKWRPSLEGIELVPMELGKSRLSLPARTLPTGWTEGLELDTVGAVLALDRFWMDGRLDAVPGRQGVYRISWPQMFHTSDSERGLLGLPEPTPMDTRVEPDVNILSGRPPLVEVRNAQNGSVYDRTTKRMGAAFVKRDGSWEWSGGDTGRLLCLLDDFPTDPLADRAATMLWFGRLQRAALAAGAHIGGQLATEEYIPVDQVEVDVKPLSPVEVELVPRPVGVPESVLEKQLRRPARAPVSASWTERVGELRRRYCFSPGARKAIETIRRRGPLRGSEVPRALEAPEAILGVPDELLDGETPAIDLSRFGERVIDVSMAPVSVKATAPRFAPGEKWSGGDIVLDAEGSDDAPAIPPEVIRTLLERAKQSGEPFQLYHGRWFDFREALRDSSRFERALTDAERGIIEGGLHPPDRLSHVPEVASEQAQSGEQVQRNAQLRRLIVHENIENLTYEDLGGSGVPGVQLLPPPESLKRNLYDYQHVGYSWLSALTENERGGLLADEMGLGKTVQVISVFARLKEAGKLRPAICVLPASLIGVWQEEIEKTCPGLSPIHVHHGPGRLQVPGAFRSFDVVLTTYETMRRDQVMLGQVRWSVVVLDEAQRIKNAPTGVTRAAKGINAGGRMALTGTPVENSLTDLWSIVDFCQPGLLGSQVQFSRRYAGPIERTPDSEASQKLLEEIKERVAPAYLRREKADTKVGRSLPPKINQRFEAPMSHEQELRYLAVLRSARTAAHGMLGAVNQLVRVCSHDWELEGIPVPFNVSEAIRRCPKLQRTLALLVSIAKKDEKAMVFSRYKVTQQILQSAIAVELRKYLGGPPAVLNGDLAATRRKDEVTRFNESEGFGVLVLSPDATGTGLTITGANHVIHYTRVWNPAKEMQATDRAHRIGQTKPVTVYYPIATSRNFESAEVKLDRILQRKSHLATEVIVPTQLEALVQRELIASIGGGN